jgi:hypothetical protein
MVRNIGFKNYNNSKFLDNQEEGKASDLAIPDQG